MISGSVVKNLPANAGGTRDMALIFGSGEGNGNPLQYYCLGNPVDRGAQWATVHGVAKSQTQLSDQTHAHTQDYFKSCIDAKFYQIFF